MADLNDAQLDWLTIAAEELVCAAAGVASIETFDLLAAYKPEMIRSVMIGLAAQTLLLAARVTAIEEALQ